MLDHPHVTHSDRQETAVIAFTIPRSEIRNVMGPGIAELMAVVTALGVGPTGPWYSYHRRLDPELFDFEIGVPVSSPVTPSGRVLAGSLPSAKVARAVYLGPYEGLGAAWSEFGAWITEHGDAGRGDIWERYLVGPESGPDGTAYRTELNRPLLD